MKKQNKKDNNSSFLVILLILAIIVIGVVLCFGWIIGAIWLLFFRKKSNMEPKKQELITAGVLTLSIISFVFMVTSLIHSSSVEEGKNNTSYVAEITTKQKNKSESTTTKKTTTKQVTTTETTTTKPPTTTTQVTAPPTTEPPATAPPTTQVTEPEAPAASHIAGMVWIDDTGKKYHSKSTCSNMSDPYQISKNEAIARGRDACKKCYR